MQPSPARVKFARSRGGGRLADLAMRLGAAQRPLGMRRPRGGRGEAHHTADKSADALPRKP